MWTRFLHLPLLNNRSAAFLSTSLINVEHLDRVAPLSAMAFEAYRRSSHDCSLISGTSRVAICCTFLSWAYQFSQFISSIIISVSTSDHIVIMWGWLRRCGAAIDCASVKDCGSLIRWHNNFFLVWKGGRRNPGGWFDLFATNSVRRFSWGLGRQKGSSLVHVLWWAWLLARAG